MKIRAEMGRSYVPLWPREYQVDKVVELPNAAFASFMIQPLDSYDFIARNEVKPYQDDGITHCLLVLNDERADGALVQCGDDGQAMYAAYVAGARDIVRAQLNRAVDFIVHQGTEHTASGSWRVYCEELDEKFGVAIQESNGLDAMLKDTLERRPEVAQAEVSLQHIETTFHPEFCRELHGGAEEKKAGIRVRDILPLLTDSDLAFFYHPEEEAPVLAEHLKRLTDTGREDYAALLNARVVEINRCAMGTGVTITDVDPEELVRFNRALDAFEAVEQAAGPVM